MDNLADYLTETERENLLLLARSRSYADDGGTRWYPPRPAPITRLVASFGALRYAADGLPLPKGLRHLNEWSWRYRVSNHLNKFSRAALREAVAGMRATLTVWLPDTPEWRYVEARVLLDALLPLALSSLRIDRRRVCCFVSDVTVVRCGAGERGGWALSLCDEALGSPPAPTPGKIIHLWGDDGPKGAA